MVTVTIEEAVKRHVGITAKYLRDLCIRGKLPAKKVGKYWHIPTAALDRLFLV